VVSKLNLLGVYDVWTSTLDLGRDDAYRNFFDVGRGGAIPSRCPLVSDRAKNHLFSDSYEVVHPGVKKCANLRGKELDRALWGSYKPRRRGAPALGAGIFD
jgi:hypothetical protein